MKRAFLLKVFPFFALSSLIIAPTLIAGACSVYRAPLDEPKALAEAAADVKVYLSLNDDETINLNKPGSVSHNVIWQTTPRSLPFVQKYLFLSGYYPTLALAEQADARFWSENLPSAVDYDFSKRFLWLKIVPADASSALADTIIDITKSSNLDRVPADLTLSPSYPDLDLSKITIIGQMDSPIVDESKVALPIGAKIVYTYSQVNNLSKKQLVSKIVSRSALAFDQKSDEFEQDLLKNIRADILPDGPRYFINQNVKPHSSTITSNVVFIDRDIPAAAVESVLEAVHPLYDTLSEEIVGTDEQGKPVYTYGLPTSSTNSNVVWNQFNQFVNNPIVASVDFLYGDYLSEADLVSRIWSLNLPTKIDFVHEKRNLWARFVVREEVSTSVGDHYFLNLTVSSRIRDVRSNVDNSPLVSLADLRNIVISGTPLHANIEERVGLDNNVGIEYQIQGFKNSVDDSGRWQSGEQLKITLKNRASDVVPLIDDPNRTIKARLQVKDIKRYAISDSKIATPNLMNFYDNYEQLLLGKRGNGGRLIKQGTINQIVMDQLKSTRENILWINSLPTLISPLRSLWYLVGPYATKVSAASAPAGEWKRSLPSSVLTTGLIALWIKPIWDETERIAPDVYNATDLLPVEWQLKAN